MSSGSWATSRSSMESYTEYSGVRYSTWYSPVGVYSTKSWNGANRVKPPATYSPHFTPTKVDHSGVKKWHMKMKKDKPRKLHSSNEFHGYVMDFQRTSDTAYRTEQTNATDLSYKYVRSSSTSEFGGGYYVDPSIAWDANDDLALIGRLREAIEGSDFNLGNFLAEAGQTVGMIADTATRVYRGIRAVRKGDFVGAATVLAMKDAHKASRKCSWRRSAADNWLELQYGWRPLLGDAYSAAHALAKLLNEPLGRTYRVRGHKALKLLPASPTYEVLDSFAEDRKQIVAKIYENGGEAVSLVGLADPASVLWEITPFSFVADWFIPIGSYLSARGLSQSVTGLYCITTTRRERFTFNGQKGKTDDGFPYSTVYSSSGAAERVRVHVDRLVSSTLDVPFPTIKPLGKAASWQHCANAVGLVTQVFAKPSGSRRSW